MVVVADLIWPAFLTPYLFGVMFPLAGIALLVTEIIIFRLWYRQTPWPPLVGAVVLANLLSSVLGIGLAFVLPSGLRKNWIPHTGVDIHAPEWKTYAVLSWFTACALSIVIEYLFIRFAFARLRLPRLLRTTSIANAASYIVLFGVVVLSSGSY